MTFERPVRMHLWKQWNQWIESNEFGTMCSRNEECFCISEWWKNEKTNNINVNIFERVTYLIQKTQLWITNRIYKILRIRVKWYKIVAKRASHTVCVCSYHQYVKLLYYATRGINLDYKGQGFPTWGDGGSLPPPAKNLLIPPPRKVPFQ